MAKVHILDQDAKKDEARVVYHIDVPNTNNAANMNYRDALVEYIDPDGAGIGSDVPNLETTDAAEFADIGAGVVYETSKTIQFDANLSNAEKAAVIDADYLATKDQILTDLQSRLDFWSMTRNPA